MVGSRKWFRVYSSYKENDRMQINNFIPSAFPSFLLSYPAKLIIERFYGRSKVSNHDR